MGTFVTVIHVITCILLVLVVMVQSGKGAEISASFGGSSQTVFGSSGGANFFVKFTQWAAAVFLLTSLVLVKMGGEANRSVFETAPASTGAAPTVPASAQTNLPAPAGANPTAPGVKTNAEAPATTSAKPEAAAPAAAPAPAAKK